MLSVKQEDNKNDFFESLVWFNLVSRTIGEHSNHYVDGTFSNGISPKVNVIARREFEITNYVVTVQYVSQYITEISLDMYFKM